jgi:hypothetical protein
MQFMANSRPVDGVTAQQLTEYFEANGFSSEAWELVQHRIVTDYAFKVGEQPGIVLFLVADSEDEARTIVDATPVVAHGLLRFEIDPLREVMHL